MESNLIRSSRADVEGDMESSNRSKVRSLVVIFALAILGTNGCTGDITLAWEYNGSEPIWSTPLVIETSKGEGLVLMGDEAGYLNALDMKTGAHKWRFPTRQDVYSSPVASPDSKRIMFGSTNYFFYCLDRNGDLLWKFPTGSRIKSDPAVWDNKVYFGSYDKKFYALSIADGSVVWTFPPKKEATGVKASILLGKEHDGDKNQGENTISFKVEKKPSTETNKKEGEGNNDHQIYESSLAENNFYPNLWNLKKQEPKKRD